MLVLGVDPGTAITGFGLVEDQPSKIRAIKYGAIRTESHLPMSQRLKNIYDEVTRLIDEFQPEVVAIESLFFNKNVKTALTVGQARGVVMLAAANSGLEVAEYTPLQVKQAVVGYGRATKNQIQEMVKLLLNLKEVPTPDDVADAMAIGICHLHSRRFKAILAGR